MQGPRCRWTPEESSMWLHSKKLCQALGQRGCGYSWSPGGCAQLEDRLWAAPVVPCGLFFRSNFGDIWPTPGEAVEGEVGELSPQLTLMETRHPDAHAVSAPGGSNEKPAGFSLLTAHQGQPCRAVLPPTAEGTHVLPWVTWPRGQS